MSNFGTATIQDHILALGDVFFETQPCPNPSEFDNIFYNCTVSINDKLEHQNQIKIYPNPNNGNFTITHNLESTNYVLEIIDLMGKVVHQGTLTTTKQTITTQQLSTGLYFVTIKSTKGELMYLTKMSVIH